MTPEEMAETYTYLATSEDTAHMTGKHLDENRQQVKDNGYTTSKDNIEAVMDTTMTYL